MIQTILRVRREHASSRIPQCPGACASLRDFIPGRDNARRGKGEGGGERKTMGPLRALLHYDHYEDAIIHYAMQCPALKRQRDQARPGAQVKKAALPQKWPGSVELAAQERGAATVSGTMCRVLLARASGRARGASRVAERTALRFRGEEATVYYLVPFSYGLLNICVQTA